jgi:NAD(P)-dependent dehydrogenase (short-subunit alcohol dehydrogenase family)
MGRFAGRGVVVTGGALGIGGECARRIGADGGSLLILDVSEAAGANWSKRFCMRQSRVYGWLGGAPRQDQLSCDKSQYSAQRIRCATDE